MLEICNADERGGLLGPQGAPGPRLRSSARSKAHARAQGIAEKGFVSQPRQMQLLQTIRSRPAPCNSATSCGKAWIRRRGRERVALSRASERRTEAGCRSLSPPLHTHY